MTNLQDSGKRPEGPPATGVKGVTILGSTGSIGVSALDVLARHPQRFRVVALTANRQVARLFEQCRRHAPDLAVMRDAHAAEELRSKLRGLGLPTEVLSGEEGLDRAAGLAQSDIVVAAIVGAAGLLPTLTAVRCSKRVLLANKEPLVMSGHILMREASRSGAQLLPVDSEHNAIFQCLPGGFRTGVPNEGMRKIFLTCSGGPFRTTPLAELAGVTPEQACAHPRWAMGRKISVDSATLMNKGLELIEACRLFGVTPDQIEIVIHPQSVVHSLVSYVDGSVLAQLGNPDMRTPIAHALAWPDRMESGVKALDLVEVAKLDFERPDPQRFPCLRLAAEAARAGGTTPAILNAANEVAVTAFLGGTVGFTDIPRIIDHVLSRVPMNDEAELEVILADDARAREAARQFIAGFSGRLMRGMQ
ncbi:MAG: 1-deoxy-D-xylulose-5-phosphate reductoisomerase [Acidiferrobacterales bacterium]